MEMWATEWFMKYQIHQLEKENKKLKEWNWELIENHKKDIDLLCEENRKLRWLQICWKTVAERIEDDKTVVRE